MVAREQVGMADTTYHLNLAQDSSGKGRGIGKSYVLIFINGYNGIYTNLKFAPTQVCWQKQGSD